MMASTTTARMLSLGILLLSCAPLASLFAVFLSIGDSCYSSDDMVTTSPDSSSALRPGEISHLSTVMQDPNATLQDLWTAIFRESDGIVSNNNINNPALNILSPNIPLHHHWTLVLPWGFSLILSVIVPLVLSCLAHLRSDHNDDDDDEQSDWIVKKERRLKRLLSAIQHFRMTLNKEHMDPTDCDAEGVPKWMVPFQGVPITSSSSSPSSSSSSPSPSCCTRRKVTGMCYICLAPYKPDDRIVWSSNIKCPHVFHEDCLLNWLVRRRKQCPCCRRTFLPKQD